MNYLIAADTDKGIKKNINQDSIIIRVADSQYGKIILAVICDGMGGLKRGEMASATVASALAHWFSKELPKLLEKGFTKGILQSQLIQLLIKENERIKAYGKSAFYWGTVKEEMVFLLCSDGFYQQLSGKELHAALHPSQLHTQEEMFKKGRCLINQNKKNLEQDNISMILIRTYGEREVC